MIWQHQRDGFSSQFWVRGTDIHGILAVSQHELKWSNEFALCSVDLS